MIDWTTVATYASVLTASALTVAALTLTAAPRVGDRRWISIAVLAVHAVLLGLHPPSLILSNAVVLLSATAAALLLRRALTTPGAVVALIITASIVDIVSFTGGPTRFLLDADSEAARGALQYLAVSIPFDSGFIPIVGIGDLLFFGALTVGLKGLGQRVVVVAPVLLLSLWAALGIGIWRGGAFGIPFMAVATIVLLSVTGKDDSTEEAPTRP